MNNIKYPLDVSIVFVNYKTKDLTISAIKSVFENTEDIKYEIFVVDNASNDGSIEAIQDEFNAIDITNSTAEQFYYDDRVPVYIIKSQINGGFGYANNLAIRQARGKYIFCLNTDTILLNNAIQIMFNFMEQNENKRVGVCGGYLVDENLKPTICGGHCPTIIEIIFKLGIKYLFADLYKRYSTALRSDEVEKFGIEQIIGADIFFRKNVLDKVGFFDENYFMYFEETDLCKRISDSKYLIKFVPNAKIQHLEQKSSTNVLRRKQQRKTSEFYYFKKHYPKQLWLVKIIYTILYLIDGYFLGHNEGKELLKYINSAHEVE